MSLAADSLLAADGPIGRRLPGWEPRPQQLEMARAIERALADKTRLLTEAPTGVGKSFAYLVPAIRRVVEHGERVVISTHTIALQEQLIEKDIPLLNAVIPEEFTAVLVKGRGNYVSLRRLQRASERQERLFPDDSVRRGLHVLEDWARETVDGSLSDLDRPPHGEVWDHVRSDSGNCMGRKCPMYAACFYQQARRRMERGNLLIVNHALFFSDLALRGAGVGFLPEYDQVILDEAHAAEEVAAEHFGRSIAETRVEHLLRVLYEPRRHRGFLTTLEVEGGDASMRLVEDAIRLVLDCGGRARAFFDGIVQWQKDSGAANGRVPGPNAFPDPLTSAMAKLGVKLAQLKDLARSDADAFELNGYAARAEEIANDAATLVEQRVPGCVYFVEGADEAATPLRRGGGTRGRGAPRRVVLQCMAVDVAEILRSHLGGEEAGLVLTSATLSAGEEDLGFVARRLGLEDAEQVRLESPFDLATQLRVVADPTMPEPRDGGYVDRLCRRIDALIERTDGGAFVLFTSFAMLRQAAERLRPGLIAAGHPVLVQGEDGPPGLLLKRFREDMRSVLFGTASFWQGVDVRGDHLRNVIITRLPFEVPDRPIVEARHERIREQGGHPFMDDQVPRAVIRFRQGVGRLIRSREDQGIVAVLDPRIVTKPYGKRFRRAFPDETRWERMDADEIGGFAAGSRG